MAPIDDEAIRADWAVEPKLLHHHGRLRHITCSRNRLREMHTMRKTILRKLKLFAAAALLSAAVLPFEGCAVGYFGRGNHQPASAGSALQGAAIAPASVPTPSTAGEGAPPSPVTPMAPQTR